MHCDAFRLLDFVVVALLLLLWLLIFSPCIFCTQTNELQKNQKHKRWTHCNTNYSNLFYKSLILYENISDINHVLAIGHSVPYICDITEYSVHQAIDMTVKQHTNSICVHPVYSFHFFYIFSIMTGITMMPTKKKMVSHFSVISMVTRRKKISM